MRLWPRRRPAPAPRANPVRIGLLEHALAGTEPAPGSWAATVLALSRAGTCMRHQPIDTSAPGEPPGTRGVCGGCWRLMELGAAGDWVLAGT